MKIILSILIALQLVGTQAEGKHIASGIRNIQSSYIDWKERAKGYLIPAVILLLVLCWLNRLRTITHRQAALSEHHRAQLVQKSRPPSKQASRLNLLSGRLKLVSLLEYSKHAVEQCLLEIAWNSYKGESNFFEGKLDSKTQPPKKRWTAYASATQQRTKLWMKKVSPVGDIIYEGTLGDEVCYGHWRNVNTHQIGPFTLKRESQQ